MKELVELKRFKEKVTRGRFAGNETEYAIIVGGDNYSWNFSRKNLNATTPPIGQKYFKGFCHLIPYFSFYGIEDNGIDLIVDALVKNTGTEVGDLKDRIEKEHDLGKIGELIDEHFKCNYNIVEHDSGKLTDPDRIYVRVLKASLKTVSKEDAK